MENFARVANSENTKNSYKGYFLLECGPTVPLAIVFVYILISKFGPKLMKNRKAFCLDIPNLMYNLFVLNFLLYSVNTEIFCGSYNFLNGEFLCYLKFDGE